MHLPEADIATIDRAAGMRGRSRAEFVREAAVRAAEEVLIECMLARMSPSGFNAFMKALAEPAAAVPEMVELLKRPAPWDNRDSRKWRASSLDARSREPLTATHDVSQIAGADAGFFHRRIGWRRSCLVRADIVIADWLERLDRQQLAVTKKRISFSQRFSSDKCFLREQGG
jgi:uncharacterized protein (DUF1778 family)